MVPMIGESLDFSGLALIFSQIYTNPDIQLRASHSITFWLLLPLLGGCFWLTSLI
jgi:hypothetical protein